MRILFITGRNIDKKGGEQALIYGRHKALYDKYGIKTDFIFIHKNTTIIDTGINGCSYIENIGYDIYSKIDSLLISNKYKVVIISGIYDFKIIRKLKKFKKNNPIIIGLDMHGSIREIYEYCIPDLYHKIGTKILYYIKRNFVKNALKISDFVFVVSDQEIEEIKSIYYKKNLEFYKIRCGTSSILDPNFYNLNRTILRKKMGIDNDTLAFVYSGSKDRWQKYEETVCLFERLSKENIKCKFHFYMNLDQSDIKELENRLGYDKVLVNWVSPETLRNELQAFDIGVLMRDSSWTNKVAFPNKFSDYINAGLNVILSESVVEPYSIAKKYNINIVPEDPSIEDLIKILNERKLRLSDYIDRCIALVENELFYDNQVKKNCLSLYEKISKL